MKFRFSERAPLVRVQVRLTGPSSTVVRQFAIDTGSTYTVVAPDVLTSIGYGSNDVERWVPMATVRVSSAQGWCW